MLTSKREVFDEISVLTTEGRNPQSTNLDQLPIRAILELINVEDHRVPTAVQGEIPYIEQAVSLVVSAFKAGGRLIYVGAGTSGRLGVLDAAECPPTFGSDPNMVQGIIAGGMGALVSAVEGAEDDEEKGRLAIREANVGKDDVVFGVAASRRTPYVKAAVDEARALGAKTVFLTMNPRENIDFPVDVAICPVVGPEVLMGSTRMKSGLAQKMVMTMVTTAAFVRMGKTYENMMIDLMGTSEKLRQRAHRVVMLVTGVSYTEAREALDKANGSVKTALVMILKDVSAEEAGALLKASDGFVRGAIQQDS
ncbi:MAG: N-acetylmuramic acid 6-phosphate etherase [Candidatus Eisenbacteria bacterium]|uniref:N-acetylmuramic acid 6-phosphate etherase n=1 Tax=Eiseniibacteriota bacterium TaxID=2212470 RepID=A0A7Y2H1Z4_UNCEI|nr:N-acetylmuramic acid 6-phosphate etherase [Candidatus Eisenbacteria bacterium]